VHVGVAGNRLFWINKLERDGREGKRRGQEARIKKGARWPALRRRLLLSLKKETGQEACRFRRRLELSWPAFGEAREQAEAQTEQHEKVSRGSPHPILSCLLACLLLLLIPLLLSPPWPSFVGCELKSGRGSLILAKLEITMGQIS